MVYLLCCLMIYVWVWCAEGARVLQLGGGTRELFYYPRETVLVTAIGDRMDAGVNQNNSVK